MLTMGSSKELGIHSGTVNATREPYAKSRSQHRRPYLRYRLRKSLGWVPLKREGDAFRFVGHIFRVFSSRPLPEGRMRAATGSSMSTGEKLPYDRFGRCAADKLAKAQRARKHKWHIAKLRKKQLAQVVVDFVLAGEG